MTEKKTSAMKVYIVDGARCPFLKTRGKPGPFSASDLAVQTGRNLLARQKFLPEQIDEVVIGCMMPSEHEANIARIIALRLGCGDKVPGWTVQRNCASGMQALDCAIKDIAIGRYDLVLAGGTEAMSRSALLFNQSMVDWLSRLNAAKSIAKQLAAMSHFRLKFLKPVIALFKGLTDPIIGLNMGQTAEEIAYQFDISREHMDQFAARSHKAAIRAKKEDHTTLCPLYDTKGHCYLSDDGVRPDSNLEKLAKLRPMFDQKFGRITAGNSSQITDGCALLLLASERAVERYDLAVIAKIVDIEWAALDPKVMGLGPVMASVPLMQRHELTLLDVDYWEINEAFAAQVLGCLKAFASNEFCQTHFGLNTALGNLESKRLNIDGGAIAIGHPVGASGARIVLQMADVLQRKQAKRGISTLCIGGGQGGAMLIERV